MTILQAAGASLGMGVLSGMTWDALKSVGKKIIDSFCEKFSSQNYFSGREKAALFLQEIGEKESYDERDPLKDVWNLYYKYTKRDANREFQQEFLYWLKTNRSNFETLQAVPTQNITVNAHGHSKVQMIGTQYNYHSGEKDG